MEAFFDSWRNCSTLTLTSRDFQFNWFPYVFFCWGNKLKSRCVKYDKLIIYIPRTQMGPLVLIEKGLVLEGWPSKIEASWVLGVYIYIYMCVYTQHIYCIFDIYTSSYPLYGAESKEVLYLFFGVLHWGLVVLVSIWGDVVYWIFILADQKNHCAKTWRKRRRLGDKGYIPWYRF